MTLSLDSIITFLCGVHGLQELQMDLLQLGIRGDIRHPVLHLVDGLKQRQAPVANGGIR